MASKRFTLSMTAAGGAFLACVGVGMIAFAFAPSAIRAAIAIATVAIAGVALVGVVILSMKRGVVRPSRGQVVLLYSTITVEFLVIWLLAPHLEGERVLWFGVLTVVGLHFLPMYWTHGVRIAWLGLACVAVAIGGLLIPAMPLFAVIAIDGALKLVFGLWMLSALPGRPAATPGAAK